MCHHQNPHHTENRQTINCKRSPSGKLSVWVQFKAKRKRASESTSRTVEVSPLVKAQQVNKVPSNDIQQCGIDNKATTDHKLASFYSTCSMAFAEDGGKDGWFKQPHICSYSPHPPNQRKALKVWFQKSLDTSKQALFEKAREQTKKIPRQSKAS